MAEKRGLIIHFMDGSKKLLEFPQQVADADVAAAAKIQQALEARHLLIEAEGALIMIPVEAIKYIQSFPAPKKLPAYAIRGVRFKG